MRLVTFGMNSSLDGCCDHALFEPDEEIHAYFTSMLNDVDLIVFGRIMYQLMFPYWAEVAKNQSGTDAENRFAEKVTAIDRMIVLQSLEHVEDKTRIIRSNPAEELLKLKQLSGKKISVDRTERLTTRATVLNR